MASVGPDLLWVAAIGSPHVDRAFDRRHADWPARSTRYMRTRAQQDLEALPLRAGRRPVLYAVTMLRPDTYAAILAEPDPTRRSYIAVQASVTRLRLADGVEEAAPVDATVGGTRLASAAWIERLQALGGIGMVEELAAIAVRRAQIGDLPPDEEDDGDPLDRYALPRGIPLGR